MAWNEPGNGKKDPWNNGQDQPPDLDEVFRNLKGRMSRMFGGSGGGGGSSSPFGPVLWIAILLLAVFAVIDSFHIIDEPERGVVMRFGKHVKTLEPGLGFTFPRPIDNVETVDVEEVRSDVIRNDMLTRDENIVEVDLAVQYRVKNASDFLFQVRDPEQTLSQATESALRQVVGDSDMDYVLLEGRTEIVQQIRTLLQEMLDRYETGLELTAVNLQDVRPPNAVKAAFDDAIQAREDRERVQNLAEAYSNEVIPRAEGQVARIIQEAEGYRDAKIARAEGEADRFSLLRSEYQRAPEVTRQRLYLETMEEIMGQSPKVLMDVNQGNNVMYLPLDEIVRNTAPLTSRQQAASSSTTQLSPNTVLPDNASRQPRTRSNGRSGRGN